eukprot:SAG31_NODE_12295_length_951_cov_3.365714_1_plen_197_part_00
MRPASCYRSKTQLDISFVSRIIKAKQTDRRHGNSNAFLAWKWIPLRKTKPGEAIRCERIINVLQREQSRIKTCCRRGRSSHASIVQRKLSELPNCWKNIFIRLEYLSKLQVNENLGPGCVAITGHFSPSFANAYGRAPRCCKSACESRTKSMSAAMASRPWIDSWRKCSSQPQSSRMLQLSTCSTKHTGPSAQPTP